MVVIECSCGFTCVSEAGFERHRRLQGPQNAAQHQPVLSSQTGVRSAGKLVSPVQNVVFSSAAPQPTIKPAVQSSQSLAAQNDRQQFLLRYHAGMAASTPDLKAAGQASPPSNGTFQTTHFEPVGIAQWQEAGQMQEMQSELAQYQALAKQAEQMAASSRMNSEQAEAIAAKRAQMCAEQAQMLQQCKEELYVAQTTINVGAQQSAQVYERELQLKEIVALRQDSELQVKEIAILAREVEDNAQAAAYFKEELVQAQAQAEINASAMYTQQSSQIDYEEKIVALRLELEDKGRLLDESTMKFASLQQQLQEVMSKSQDVNEISELQLQEMGILKQDHEIQLREIAALKEYLKDKDIRLVERTKELTTLRTELEDVMSAADQGEEVRMLRQELQDVMSAAGQGVKDVMSAAGQGLKDVMSGADQGVDVRMLRQELQENQSYTDKLQQEVAELRAAAEVAWLNEAKRGDIEKLKQEVAEYQFAEIASVEVARLYEGKYQGNEAYCEQLQQEVCGLRVQVEGALPLTDNAAEITRLRNELAQVEDVARAASTDANELETLLLQEQNELKNVQGMLVENEQTAMHAVEQNNASSQELNALRSQLARVEANAQKLSFSHEELLTQLQNMNEVASAATMEADSLKGQNEALRDQVHQLTKQLAHVVDFAEGSSADHVARAVDAEAEVAVLKRRIAELEAAKHVRSLSNTIVLEQTTPRLEQRIQELEIQLAEASNTERLSVVEFQQLQQNQIILEDRVKTAEAESQEQKRLADNRWQKVKSIETMYASEANRAATAEKEVERLNQCTATAEREVEQLKGRIVELSNTAAPEKSDVSMNDLASAKAQLVTADAYIITLGSQLKALAGQIAQKDAEAAAQQQIIKNKDAEAAAQEQRIKDAEASQLLRAKDFPEVSAQAQLEDSKDQIQALSLEVEGLRQEATKALEERLEKEHLCKTLHTKNVQQSLDIGRLQSKLGEKEQQLASEMDRITKDAEDKAQDSIAYELTIARKDVEMKQAEIESLMKDQLAFKIESDEKLAKFKSELEKVVSNWTAKEEQVMDYPVLQERMKTYENALTQKYDAVEADRDLAIDALNQESYLSQQQVASLTRRIKELEQQLAEK